MSQQQNMQLHLGFFSRNVSLSLFIALIINLQSSAMSAPKVPCFFIFGDSLVDNGNNNDLNTSAKVNHPPYGDDFPQGPTGRFTNGRNIADILVGANICGTEGVLTKLTIAAQRLGFDSYIPPFATAQGDDIINGVNYASGSSGILGETGKQLGENICLERQLQNHNLTISRLSHSLANDTSVKTHLNKCLYYFVIGSNDYLNNYFVPEYYRTSSMYTPQDYATLLVQQYSRHLKTLYDFGARKISVSGLGALGCIPSSLARDTKGSGCVDSINDAVQLFNEKLKVMVDELNHNLPDAEFIYIGVERLMPAQLLGLGIKFMTEPCCKVSESTGQCVAGESPCHFRALHFFFDNFHPTEIINKLAATAAYPQILKLIS